VLIKIEMCLWLSTYIQSKKKLLSLLAFPHIIVVMIIFYKITSLIYQRRCELREIRHVCTL